MGTAMARAMVTEKAEGSTLVSKKRNNFSHEKLIKIGIRHFQIWVHRPRKYESMLRR